MSLMDTRVTNPIVKHFASLCMNCCSIVHDVLIPQTLCAKSNKSIPSAAHSPCIDIPLPPRLLLLGCYRKCLLICLWSIVLTYCYCTAEWRGNETKTDDGRISKNPQILFGERIEKRFSPWRKSYKEIMTEETNPPTPHSKLVQIEAIRTNHRWQVDSGQGSSSASISSNTTRAWYKIKENVISGSLIQVFHFLVCEQWKYAWRLKNFRLHSRLGWF